MSRIPIIETCDLSIGYFKSGKHKTVLNKNINIQLFTGELTALLGPNGAGKSTLLKTLCGFHPPVEGSIRIQGKTLKNMTNRELSRNIGVVLTEKTNAGGITVRELVSLGRQPYTGFFGRLDKEDEKIIDESIEAAGIMHKVNSYIAELSDGERQKVMIAKVLAQQCPLIILDEPTAFLDVTSKIETMALLKKLATDQAKAILLTTHDVEIVLQISDTLWLMKTDNQIITGSPEKLISDGSVSTFFNNDNVTFDISGKRFVLS
jgi:iron complex transport system ATP-binding protein